MKIHNLQQGSPEWDQFRLDHFGASEAAAMLGISNKVTRNELLHMKHTGQAKEYSDWVENKLFANGHEVEALARPIVEETIGDELFPVTCSDGHLSASCDGLTLDGVIAWEHKQWNEDLANKIRAGILPDEYMPQCQQILTVTGADKLIFTVSDGTEHNKVDLTVEHSIKWMNRISRGWTQFQKDLAEYKPREIAEKPEAEAIMQLPALSIQIKGEVTTSNLPQFKEAADTFIANIKTDLQTDEDFANAEATVKFCGDTEKKIELAKNAAIAQTASIDELMRTMDHIKESMRVKRLALEKLVKTQKEAIKNKIIADAKAEYQKHTDSLHEEIKPIRWEQENPRFAEVVKNKRTLASLHNAVDTELARCKIASDAIAKDIREKLSWFKENSKGSQSLFPDISTIIANDIEYFKMVVQQRITDHDKKVAEEAQRKIDEAKASEEKAKQESIEAENRSRLAKENEEKRIQAAKEEADKQAAKEAEMKRQMEEAQERDRIAAENRHKASNKHKTETIKAATESLATIIESTPAKLDLSTVIINAISEGKITNVTIQY